MEFGYNSNNAEQQNKKQKEVKQILKTKQTTSKRQNAKTPSCKTQQQNHLNDHTIRILHTLTVSK